MAKSAAHCLDYVPMIRTTTKLYRPVGLFELGLIWDAEMKRFPPRLPHQPIFYPVMNIDYARQIARDWNTTDSKSGYAGYVTTFAVDSKYLSQYELQTVGSSEHQEYWIPAQELDRFNTAIVGGIEILEAFFGDKFTGFVPQNFVLKGKNAIEQFRMLTASMNYSPFDFVCEITANRKACFLNYSFWACHDFTSIGISNAERERCLKYIRDCWTLDKAEIRLPSIG